MTAADYTDLPPDAWKNGDVILDSLWLFGKRDDTPPHSNALHGAFIPQLPRQLIQRYTKPGDIVVDLFVGGATTLVECLRLGRYGIGLDLEATAAENAVLLTYALHHPADSHAVVVTGDATEHANTVNVIQPIMRRWRPERPAADLLILHPPYWNIIRFSADDRDLSAKRSPAAFIDAMKDVASNARALLAPQRFLGLVMGDVWHRGSWYPLAFRTMEVFLQAGFQLKAINIKNIVGNERGKGKQTNLWRYRAFKNGTSLFSHEYIFVLQRHGCDQEETLP